MRVQIINGSGKTTLLCVLVALLRKAGKRVLVMASTGVASILLPTGVSTVIEYLCTGNTAHTALGIPVKDINELSVCRHSKQSRKAAEIIANDVYIWDEAAASQRDVLACVERTLNVRPLTKGGVTGLLGHARRRVRQQVVRVRRRRSPSGAYCAARHAARHRGGVCLHVAALAAGAVTVVEGNCIEQVTTHNLTENLRVMRSAKGTSDERKEHCEWLLRVGNGVEQRYAFDGHDDYIKIPAHMVVDSLDDLLVSTFPSLFDTQPTCLDEVDQPAIRKAAILTPKNKEADIINDLVIDRFPGAERVYRSADYAETGKSFKSIQCNVDRSLL